MEATTADAGRAPRLAPWEVFYQACRAATRGPPPPRPLVLTLELLAGELGLRQAEAWCLLQAARRRGRARPRPGAFDARKVYLAVSRYAHAQGGLHPEDRGLLDRLAQGLGLGGRLSRALDWRAVTWPRRAPAPGDPGPRPPPRVSTEELEVVAIRCGPRGGAAAARSSPLAQERTGAGPSGDPRSPRCASRAA